MRNAIVIPPTLKRPADSLRLSPRDITRAFVDANANLKPTNMAVTCTRGELVDVRICLTHDLRAFATCPEITARAPAAGESIRVAPVR